MSNFLLWLTQEIGTGNFRSINSKAINLLFLAGEVDVSFSEVLAFVTGADNIPPCGFTKQVDLDFYPCEDQRLPSASTCALQLWIPRVTDPDMVSAMMLRAVKESHGFLKV